MTTDKKVTLIYCPKCGRNVRSDVMREHEATTHAPHEERVLKRTMPLKVWC